MPSSSICRYEDFLTDWHKRFADRLGLGQGVQRKGWEFTALTAALEERGFLEPGRKALGFAVGREPLASYFASRGVDVLATDLAAEQSSGGWIAREQHAADLSAIHHPNIVDAETFNARVRFLPADMRRLDERLGVGEYDFLWSSCAMEHLGTLEKGADFVRGAMRFLKPGGIAVHTTEYNVGSNAKTRFKGSSVIYRRQDLEALDYSLRMMRCGMEPINFDSGVHPFDLDYDQLPWGTNGRRHIKVMHKGFLFTSMLMVIHKGG